MRDSVAVRDLMICLVLIFVGWTSLWLLLIQRLRSRHFEVWQALGSKAYFFGRRMNVYTKQAGLAWRLEHREIGKRAVASDPYLKTLVKLFKWGVYVMAIVLSAAVFAGVGRYVHR